MEDIIKRNWEVLLPDIFSRFSEIADKYPDHISLQMRGDGAARKYTFRDVKETASATGRYLIHSGVGKGDRVAIFSENSPEWGIAYLGIVAAGAVAVPLDAQYAKEEVGNLLNDSGSRAVFTSKGLLPIVIETAEGLGINIVILGEPLPDSPLTVFPNIHEDDTASLLYTSGTTGAPKGVMLTHGNLLSNADALIGSGIVTPEEHVLCILPLHHTYPFMVCFLTPLLSGGRSTFLNSLKGPDIVRAVRGENVSILVGVPQLFGFMRKGLLSKMDELPSRLMRYVVRSLFLSSRGLRKSIGLNAGKVIFRKIHREFGHALRFFACGGARLDPEIAWDLEGLGFTVVEGYGLTETSPVVAMNLPEHKRIGSVGRVIDRVEVRIENPDRAGVGEVLIKGPNVMKGYYRRPDLTADVIRDGWFRSGDLGCIDPGGFLFITGRSKEVIVLSSGKNVYPEDVESHYLKSPYIKEICITGIPDPGHPGSCEGIKALVFPNHERLAADGIVNVGESIRWQIEKYSAELPSYKRAMEFAIIKEPLPRTHLGKIRRFMVGEISAAEIEKEAEVSAEDSGLLETEAGLAVLKAISSVTDKRVLPGSSLELDLGIDSLGRVELAVALEKALGRTLPQNFASEIVTVKDAILKVAEYAKNGKGQGGEGPVSWAEIIDRPLSERMKGKIISDDKWLPNFFLRLISISLFAAWRLMFRLEVRGIENLPAGRGCIIAPNHVSFLDGFIVGAALRRRLPRLYAVGFQGFFSGKITSRLAKITHIIGIDADSGLVDSLQASAFLLKRDMALIVFPEGGRSVDGRLLPFKKGVGILAKELKVPLVPVYIAGAFDVLPRGAWVPRLRKVIVTCGPAIFPEECAGLDYQETTSLLRERVAAIAGGDG